MLATSAKTVREYTVELPGAVELFEELGLDYCCGGNVELDRACARAGIPFEPVLARLEALTTDLKHTAPLVGWASAPLPALIDHILATHHDYTRKALRRIPALLDKVVAATIEYVSAQVEAGADAIMLFDTHAGLLAPPDYDDFAARPVEQVFRALGHEGVPRIYYSNGTAGVLSRIARLPVQVVGLDFRVDLGAARDILGPGMAVQGNLDPAALLGSPDAVRQRARRVLEANAGRPGHIMNLGHGILPHTPLPCVEALVDTVRSWRQSA